MNGKVLVEGLIVGIAVQAIIGSFSPGALIATGFLAGVVTRKEHEGMLSGAILGIIVGFGYLLSFYAHIHIPYLYSTALIITGAPGAYARTAVSIVLGLVGGWAGGSVIRRWSEESYMHGKMAGELDRASKEYRNSKRKS